MQQFCNNHKESGFNTKMTLRFYDDGKFLAEVSGITTENCMGQMVDIAKVEMLKMNALPNLFPFATALSKA